MFLSTETCALCSHGKSLNSHMNVINEIYENIKGRFMSQCVLFCLKMNIYIRYSERLHFSALFYASEERVL